VATEYHQRSPATRSYTQEEAMEIYGTVGFESIEVYSGFTFEPVKSVDTLFTLIGQRAEMPV